MYVDFDSFLARKNNKDVDFNSFHLAFISFPVGKTVFPTGNEIYPMNFVPFSTRKTIQYDDLKAKSTRKIS